MYEGEEPPTIAGAERQALQVFKMLSNGMGGLDWSALTVAAEMYGVHNLEELIDNLVSIKGWKRPGPDKE